MCLRRVAVSSRHRDAKTDARGQWGRVVARGGSVADGFDWRGRNRGVIIGAGSELALCLHRCRHRDASGTVGDSFFSLPSGTNTDHSAGVVVVFDRHRSGSGAHFISVAALVVPSLRASLCYGDVRRVQNTGAGAGPALS